MRLIDTATLELVGFVGGDPDTPKYAILSHTWEDGEITYQDYTQPNKSCETKKGFNKIRHTCMEAQRNGIGYAWVDTCCIDKTSSTELTEAINSMYYWYSQAAVCYVYLSDLDSQHPVENDGSTSP